MTSQNKLMSSKKNRSHLCQPSPSHFKNLSNPLKPCLLVPFFSAWRLPSQSMQRLPTEDSEANLVDIRNHENLSHIVPDENGNLFVSVRKTKPILGIAIEGGANTKHPLPRIINIHVSWSAWKVDALHTWLELFIQEHGAAYEAGGLEVGQLILEVDSTKVEKMQHQVSRKRFERHKSANELFTGCCQAHSGVLREPWSKRDYVPGCGG